MRHWLIVFATRSDWDGSAVYSSKVIQTEKGFTKEDYDKVWSDIKIEYAKYSPAIIDIQPIERDQ